MPAASLRALLADAIDYAGLFPPASLTLEPALRNHAEYVRLPDAWMLGTFILPVAEFDAAARRLSPFKNEYPLRISALGPRAAVRSAQRMNSSRSSGSSGSASSPATRAATVSRSWVPGALAVEWQTYPGSRPNPEFIGELTAATKKDEPVMFICRSGARSHSAAEAAMRAGWQETYNVLEGFEGDKDAAGHRNTVGGWRKAGLPWKQS